MTTVVNRMPGIGTLKETGFRNLWISREGRRILPLGKIVDGAKSRDPLNTGDVDVLRAGLLLGKITATGKYAPSVLGVTAESLESDETALDLPAAVVTEMKRRIGDSGTFKLVGPPTAGGTVRAMTVTYSGFADADTVTVTALGVNEVQTVAIAGTLSAGGYSIRLIDKDGKLKQTAVIAYNASVANVQTALDAVTAANAIVAGGTAQSAMTLTFSGANYAALPQTLVEIIPDGLTGMTTIGVTRTTAGVDGRFVTGSLVMPTDGSETPRAIFDKADGLQVTDEDRTTNLDIQCVDLVFGGGVVDASQILNYPADTATQAWLKAQLRAVGGPWVFDDDF
jgi:hypothetical protein